MGAGPTRPPARERRPSGALPRFDDAEPITFVLVRHGETALTVSKAYSGSSVPGPSLSGHGRVQAAKAADLVYRIGRDFWPDMPRPRTLVASPMVRTQETAAALGRRLGLHVHTDAAFAEADFGAWEGLPGSEIAERWPDLVRRWHLEGDVRAPGGESLVDIGARVGAGLERLLADGVDRTVAIASHTIAIRSAVGVTLGLQPSRWASVRVPPASVTVLRWWADGGREVTVVGMPTDV